MGKRVAKEIDRVVQGFYPVLENHYVQFRTMDNSYPELVGRFSQLEKAQEQAVGLDEGNIKLYMTGYELCNKVIEMPLKYSSMDKTAAVIDAVGGALDGNKYSGKYTKNKAINKHENARELEKLVMKTALEVVKLQEKYTIGIKKINPSEHISSSSSGIKQRMDKITTKENSKKKWKKAAIYYFISLFVAVQIMKGIGIMQESPSFGLLIIMFAPLIIGYVGYSAD
jgi:hypothetical protein